MANSKHLKKRDMPTANGSVKEWKEFLTLCLELQNSYHDHKENMAHAVLLLNLGFVGAMVNTANPFPPWVGDQKFCRFLAMLALMIIWLSIHYYMRWQLRNRRTAAAYCEAIPQVLRIWVALPLATVEICENPPKVKDSWIDRWLFPWLQQPRVADDGLKGYPNMFVDLLTEEKKPTGAVTAEEIVSIGSLLLGVLLLVRLIVAWQL